MEGAKASLPPKAYDELKPGERYVPFIPAEKIIPEVSSRSVLWGMFMAAVFTLSIAYLALKVGTVPEAAIPIAILAVGLGHIYSRRNTLLENVIIQSIGAASGAIVGGSVFTIPALFILGLRVNFLMIFLSAFLGGCLGIFFLIPLRRYFCLEQHGKLPFPEATATTEILISGEGRGEQARVLILGIAVGAVYEFLAIAVRLWNELLTFLWISPLAKLAEKTKIILKIDALSAFIGLGYIIGLRYNAVIVAGGLLSHFALIPVISFLGQHLSLPIYPGDVPLASMSETQIFSAYVQKIGIGAIFMAGLIGIAKSMPTMVKSFSIGFKEMFRGKKGAVNKEQRTDTDLRMATIIVGILLTSLGLFFYFLWISNLKIALIGVFISVILSFLFTTVAAYAIAIVGTNPVSGMTLVTVILSSVILLASGLSGTEGMAVALLIGAVVCTALSLSGVFITDLKIGYWLGSTPRNQERFKFSGVLVSAAAVGLAVFILDKAFSFQSGTLPAPQANLMAAIIKSLMSGQPVTWLLFGIGIFVALLIEMLSVPTLAFALGMYLPLELTTPLLVGGLLAHLVRKSSRDKGLASKRHNRAVLLSSGFIAGGAMMGIVLAFLKLAKIDHFLSLGIPMVLEQGKWVDGNPADWYSRYGEVISLFTFILLLVFVYWNAKKAKKEEQ